MVILKSQKSKTFGSLLFSILTNNKRESLKEFIRILQEIYTTQNLSKIYQLL